MYTRNSGFAPHRRQGGFIQGAILFALVILAVVVAAFSLASRDSNSSADTETARVGATLVLKTGSDIANGISRAVSDGLAAADAQANLVLTGTVATGKLDLFDTTLRYASRPEIPENALADGTAAAQPFGAGTTGADAATLTNNGNASLLGGANLETILEVPGLTELVCKRINNLTVNTLVNATVPTGITSLKAADGSSQAREGCYSNSGNFTYFRVVLVDTAPAAAAGGGGGGGGGGA
jgi:hypothetical protein